MCGVYVRGLRLLQVLKRDFYQGRACVRKEVLKGRIGGVSGDDADDRRNIREAIR